MKLSYSDYDYYLEVFEKMSITAGNYVPDDHYLDMLEKRFASGKANEYVPFLLWIEDTGEETKENKAARARLLDMLQYYVEIVPDNMVPHNADKDDIINALLDSLEAEAGYEEGGIL